MILNARDRRILRRALRRAALVGLAPMVAACTIVTPDPVPTLAPPAAYREAAAATVAWPAPDWWRGFGSAELDRLIARAQAGNFDIAAARARIRQADAQATIAGAPLLPTVQFSGGAQRQGSTITASSRTATGLPVGATRNIASNSFDARLTASWEADVWGGNRAAAAAASASVAATRFDADTVALTTVAGVADTYFQILALRERLTLARRSLADAATVLEGVQARALAGTASELDVAQQRSLVESERATIPVLADQLVQRTTALAILVGVAPSELAIGAGEVDDLRVPVPDAGLPADLLRRRPDVAAAEADLIAADQRLKTAIAAKYPATTLTIGRGYESAALRDLLNPASLLFSLAASITQPLFEGGRLDAQVSLERARIEELAQLYQRTVVQAFADVENALSAIARADEEIAARRAALEAARLAFEAAQSRYRAGTVDTITVLDTQRSLSDAEDALAQARLAYLRGVVALHQALGGGWGG
jgi:outer membrane protein, multidrug efflux system